MTDYKQFFKNKKVTVMGLGLLGKGLGDARFLAQSGADLIVTDLKTKEQLAPSLKALRKYKNIKFVLGEHRLEDFENRDFVLKSQDVLLDSPYIKHSREKKIPIWMDDILFAHLAPEVKIVGITGTRGKTTTTMLIYHILKCAGKSVHLGGNIKGVATLELLPKVKSGDIVVLELSSWQLQGFGDHQVSPHISIFTNFMPDHLNYYKNDLKVYFQDKSYIYKFQNKNDFLVLGESMKMPSREVKAKKIIAKANSVPKSWKVKLLGNHNMQNIACAVEAVRILGLKENDIKKGVESFAGVSGRLELAREVLGVKIYNDTTSTTPTATTVALNSFNKKVILIMGGMDKGIDVKNLNKILNIKTKKVFLTPGSGSDKIVNKKANVEKMDDLKEAVNKAYIEAKKGDIILFSPGFASFNVFKNEYDRGEQFMKLIKKLK